MRSLLDSLSPATLALVAAACLIQLSLQIWCLIDLSRRATVYGGRKWVWALIIIGIGFLGVLLYRGLGRAVYESSGGDEGAGSETATRRALDDLYGDKR